VNEEEAIRAYTEALYALLARPWSLCALWRYVVADRRVRAL
jgi:hypothetical protein